MEHTEKIKELLDGVANLSIDNVVKGVTKDSILEKLDAIQQELIEIEKMQNYTNASVSTKEKNPEPQKEMVNHPLHYQGLEVNGVNVECIDVMGQLKGWFKTAIFCELNAFKYNWRAGEKDNISQELGKISWYGNKAQELWNKAIHWHYPKNDHEYAIVDIGMLRMKNPATKEWVNAVLYTDGKGFYVREYIDFTNKFKYNK